MVECLDIRNVIHKFMVFKMIFGVANLGVSIAFFYFFLNYQKRGKTVDRLRNNMVFVFLVTETLFNVAPGVVYWIFYSVSRTFHASFNYCLDFPV
jgi:cytochrome bd-type quinol oxidase subunit 1